MLRLSPSVVAGLATLFEADATPKPCPGTGRRPASPAEQVAFEYMPVVIPADPVRGPMAADGADEAELN